MISKDQPEAIRITFVDRQVHILVGKSKHLHHDLRVVIVEGFKLLHHLLAAQASNGEHAHVVGNAALLLFFFESDARTQIRSPLKQKNETTSSQVDGFPSACIEKRRYIGVLY